MYIYIYTCMYIYIYMYIYVYVCIYIYMYICIYIVHIIVYIYIYIGSNYNLHYYAYINQQSMLEPQVGLLIILRIKLLQVKDRQQGALKGSEVPQHHTCHGRGVLNQSGVQQDHGNFPQAKRWKMECFSRENLYSFLGNPVRIPKNHGFRQMNQVHFKT